MANVKTITELTTLAAVDSSTDWLPVVDASDTTESSNGTTKKAVVSQFIGDTGAAATVDAGTTTTGAAGTDASVVNAGTTSAAVFNFTIPRGNTGATGAAGSDGTDGDSAYVYIAYASDASGTDFTTTFSATLDYIAVKTTTTEITTPQASDFTGLWKNYKGAQGIQGIQGEIGLTGAAGADGADGANAYVYIAYASDSSGTGFTTTFDAGLDYVAIKATTTEIVTPQASDFTGLWKNYKGATGAQGVQGDPGVDGTDGLDINWLGVYDAGTGYVINDAVFYDGSSYICILASTGNLPTNTTYWDLMAQQGAAGVGSGDVSGPSSATNNAIARFDLTTGKLIKDSLVTVDDSGSVNIPADQSYLVNGSPVSGYSDEQAQDAVGTILADSTEIDFTYDDTTPSITAVLKNGSIDETKLDTSTNSSLDLADSALQSITTSASTNLTGFIKGNGTNVLANTSAVVAGTSTTARTTAAKTCTIAGYTLTAGDLLAITFTDGFAVNNATLNINGGGAVNIRVGAVNVTTALLSVAAGTSFTLPLYYDGTHFYVYGSQLNTNTTYTEISEAEITAGTATTARSISGRRAEFLAASIKDRTETLTNKTITSPVINTGVSGSAIKDEDNMASDSNTHLATQQSIKAYVDAQGFTWEGPWATSTPYAVNDTVENNGSGYVCTSAHTSGATTEPGVGASWTSYWDLFVEGVGGNSLQVDSSETSGNWGTLTGDIDGSNQIFEVSLGSYIVGSTKVYINGQLLTQGPGDDYIEYNASAGEIQIIETPLAGDVITVTYQFTTGATGNADTLDGLHASAFASAGYVYKDTLYFTSNGTFSKGDYPWLKAIRVKCQGGGGGGGGASTTGASNPAAGSGGGGGGFAEKFITDISGLSSSESITVGTGGGGNTNANGSAGNNTTAFGLTGNGGSGGTNGPDASTDFSVAPPGDGGSSSGGDINIGGGAGYIGVTSVQRNFGGNGGDTLFGLGE
jgi:hypothetical protein